MIVVTLIILLLTIIQLLLLLLLIIIVILIILIVTVRSDQRVAPAASWPMAWAVATPSTHVSEAAKFQA